MEQDLKENPSDNVKIETNGVDAAIVSGLFLLTFVIQMLYFKNLGYVIGSITLPALVFVAGYLLSKRYLKSIRDFRIVYVGIYLVLFFGVFRFW